MRLPTQPSQRLKERNLQQDDLPHILRTTDSLIKARQTVERLSAEGCVAIILEDFVDQEVFCAQHSSMLATHLCDICQRKICRLCIRVSQPQNLCAEHSSLARNRNRLVRIRQLFLVFLFVAFLYQILAFTQSDQERVTPYGPVYVAILQYTPPGTAETPIIQALNAPDSPHNLSQIQRWYNNERKRYGGTRDRYMEFTVFPTMTMQDSPPSLNEDSDSIWLLTLSSWKYLRFFNRLARARDADDRFGARVFILYENSDSDLAAHSRGSEKGRLAVAHVDLNEHNPAYALTTIAHELGHVLGAADTYNFDTFRADHPEGFVEPFSTPLYPQRFAEVMAVDIPMQHNLEAEVQDLSQVRVGYQTAAQFGWISEEAANTYYTPPHQRPEDRLPPRQAAPITPSSTPPDTPPDTPSQGRVEDGGTSE